MSSKKLLYIFSRAPYSTAGGQEALDAALIGAAFEQEVSVLFLHDGVFMLKEGQNADDSALKQFTKAFAALEDFGIEQIFTHDMSLAARGLDEGALMIGSKVLDADGIRQLIRQQDRVFTF